jgi:hypothetical protein
MKAKITIFMMITIICLSCSQQKKNPIEGAWNLVYDQRIEADTLVWKFPGDFKGSEIKIWSKGYVLYVGKFVENNQDTTVTDGWGGGPYKKIDGNVYEESIQYFSEPSFIGMRVRMLLEVRNDTLIQTWPADENGQIDKSNFRQQKRVRLD